MVSESIYIYVTIRALTLGRYRNTILNDSSPVYSVPYSSRNQFLGLWDYFLFFTKYSKLFVIYSSLYRPFYIGLYYIVL